MTSIKKIVLGFAPGLSCKALPSRQDGSSVDYQNTLLNAPHYSSNYKPSPAMLSVSFQNSVNVYVFQKRIVAAGHPSLKQGREAEGACLGRKPCCLNTCLIKSSSLLKSYSPCFIPATGIPQPGLAEQWQRARVQAKGILCPLTGLPAVASPWQHSSSVLQDKGSTLHFHLLTIK